MSGLEDVKVIKGIVILDNEGSRIFSKYFDSHFSRKPAVQQDFEKLIFAKTSKSTFARNEIDILLVEEIHSIVLYRFEADVHFFVVGSRDENEALLAAVLSGLVEALLSLFQDQFDKRTLLEHFDALVVAVDEVVDEGIVMETDPHIITNRVILQAGDQDDGSRDDRRSSSSSSTGELTLAQVFRQAKEQLERTFK